VNRFYRFLGKNVTGTEKVSKSKDALFPVLMQSTLPIEIGNPKSVSFHLNALPTNTKTHSNYHAAINEPPVIHKTTDCVHQARPRKRA